MKNILNFVLSNLKLNPDSQGSKDDSGLYYDNVIDKKDTFCEIRLADHKAFLQTFATRNPPIHQLKPKVLKRTIDQRNQILSNKSKYESYKKKPKRKQFYTKYQFYDIVFEDEETKGNLYATRTNFIVQQCVIKNEDIDSLEQIDLIVSDILYIYQNGNHDECKFLEFKPVQPINEKEKNINNIENSSYKPQYKITKRELKQMINECVREVISNIMQPSCS